MSDSKATRTWQDVAAEICTETDAARMLCLCEEINALLEIEKLGKAGPAEQASSRLAQSAQ